MENARYYDYLDSYASFIMREAYNQERIAVCINEAILLTEGASTSEFHVLHEGFTDKIKELWNKFVGFINKIWLKFKSFFDRILDTDRGWVEQYKTIITQRPLKLDVSMTNYQEAVIAAVHPEHFDPTKIDNMLRGNLEYAKSIPGISNVLTKHNGSEAIDDIKSSIKIAMCGGTEEEKENMQAIINMTNVYNFIHDYKSKIVDDIQKDMNAIVASAKAFEDLINELEADAKAKAAEAETANPGQDRNNNNNNQQQKSTNQNNNQTQQRGSSNQTDKRKMGKVLDNNGKTHAAFMGADGKIYLNTGGSPQEIKVDPAGGQYLKFIESANYLYTPFSSLSETIKTSASGSSGGTRVNKGGMAGGVSQAADTKFVANQRGLQGSETNKDIVATTKAGKTQAEIEKAVLVYKEVNQGIQSVKQTVCTNMYNDYKSLIKAHIASYVGEVDNTDGSKAGTNFKNGQPQGTPGNPNPEPQPQG